MTSDRHQRARRNIVGLLGEQLGSRVGRMLKLVAALADAAILAVKTLSNYVNHLADTPVDRMFSRWEWQAEAA